ncbi:MAG: MFS transporter [Chloroflexota bacterium]
MAHAPGTHRPRIFYGWYIIALTCVSSLFAGGTSQAFFGVFVRSIEADTGWTRTTIAGAITTATFLGGATSWLAGTMADRYGPRGLMTLGVAAYTLGYLGMGLVGAPWQLYPAYISVRLSALHLLSGTVPRTAAVNWFRRMRGRTVGFQTMAMPLGGALLAALAGVLLGTGMGWRTVFMLYGGAAGALLLVPTPLLMRTRPEDMGLQPDGDPAPEPGAPATPTAQRRDKGPEVAWTLRQSLRTRALWMVAAAMMLYTWASGGISFHLAAYYGDLGLSGAVAAGAASLFLVGGAVSAGVWGFLSERYDERWLAIGATLAALGLTVYGRFIGGPVSALAFAGLYGATTRGEGALLMMILANYFGRRNFGGISGFASQFNYFGLGLGPLVSALIFDVTGSYHGVFTTASVMLGAATLALWLATRPRPA